MVSKGRKAIDMEMEKQMFGKISVCVHMCIHVCWTRQGQWDTDRNFNKKTFLGSSLSTYPV